MPSPQGGAELGNKFDFSINYFVSRDAENAVDEKESVLLLHVAGGARKHFVKVHLHVAIVYLAGLPHDLSPLLG